MLPRVSHVPRASLSDGDDAAFLSSAYGLTPDDWQDDVLGSWLARRKDGRWASATCGLAVPRQNGKNGLIEMRELFGMVELGEKFLHTAHEVKTARKAFLRILSFFENEREYPELAALVSEIRKTNGQEAIALKNGGGVEFVARSRGSGRGFTVDVLVCDEAQELTDEELAALLPTISASPKRNPQVILTGTPPDPDKPAQGEVFRRTRSDGENRRDARLCWTDFGLEDGPLPDLDDRGLWQERNPALGLRLHVDEVERERGLMSDDAFARERLGWWGDPQRESRSPFGTGNWEACLDTEVAEPTVGIAVALAVSFDQAFASIAASAPLDDGRLHVGAVERARGTSWVVARLKQIQDTHRCPVIIDGRGPAAMLISALEAADVEVTIAATADVFNACASIFEMVQSGQIVHHGYAELDEAVAGAKKRESGDRWAWGRKTSSFDVSMLEAATLAAWGTNISIDLDPEAFFI